MYVRQGHDFVYPAQQAPCLGTCVPYRSREKGVSFAWICHKKGVWRSIGAKVDPFLRFGGPFWSFFAKFSPIAGNNGPPNPEGACGRTLGALGGPLTQISFCKTRPSKSKSRITGFGGSGPRDPGPQGMGPQNSTFQGNACTKKGTNLLGA